MTSELIHIGFYIRKYIYHLIGWFGHAEANRYIKLTELHPDSNSQIEVTNQTIYKYASGLM